MHPEIGAAVFKNKHIVNVADLLRLGYQKIPFLIKKKQSELFDDLK